MLLGPDDAVLSDELNHASIIDGIRLCRAKRLRYKHMDLGDLENKLRESQVSGQNTACCMLWILWTVSPRRPLDASADRLCPVSCVLSRLVCVSW